MEQRGSAAREQNRKKNVQKRRKVRPCEKTVTTLIRDETATCIEAKCRYAATNTFSASPV